MGVVHFAWSQCRVVPPVGSIRCRPKGTTHKAALGRCAGGIVVGIFVSHLLCLSAVEIRVVKQGEIVEREVTGRQLQTCNLALEYGPNQVVAHEVVVAAERREVVGIHHDDLILLRLACHLAVYIGTGERARRRRAALRP